MYPLTEVRSLVLKRVLQLIPRSSGSPSLIEVLARYAKTCITIVEAKRENEMLGDNMPQPRNNVCIYSFGLFRSAVGRSQFTEQGQSGIVYQTDNNGRSPCTPKMTKDVVSLMMVRCLP